MSVQVNIIIAFEADDEAQASTLVNAMNLPVGAQINTRVHQSLDDASGVVGDNGIIEPGRALPAP